MEQAATPQPSAVPMSAVSIRPSTPAEGKAMRDLKRHLQDLKVMLCEEVKVRENLGRERAATMSELANVEAAIVTEREKHAKAMEALAALRVSKATELQNRLQELHAEKSDLEVDLGSWEESLAQNNRMRQEVYKARIEADQEAVKIQEEEERVRTSTFNLRLELKNITRHTLTELDAEYHERAAADLQMESDCAERNNSELKAAREARATAASKALVEQGAQAQRLRDVRVEHELLSEAKSSHDQRFTKIAKSLQKADSLVATRQARVAKAHVALRKAQAEHGTLRDGLKDLDELNRRLTDLQDLCRRRRSRALQCARIVARFASDHNRGQKRHPMEDASSFCNSNAGPFRISDDAATVITAERLSDGRMQHSAPPECEDGDRTFSSSTLPTCLQNHLPAYATQLLPPGKSPLKQHISRSCPLLFQPERHGGAAGSSRMCDEDTLRIWKASYASEP